MVTKKDLTKNEKGLSMLEIIVALSVISIVFFGLMNIYPFGMSITSSAKEDTVAGFLAQEKIESLRSRGYEDIGVGSIEDKHRLSSDKNDYRYDYWRETQVEYVDEDLDETDSLTGLKKIRSVVYYVDSLTKKEKSYDIVTLISE
jgi:Tfp pilus assembly protein PilV